jgi:hypothetical protein
MDLQEIKMVVEACGSSQSFLNVPVKFLTEDHLTLNEETTVNA